jgi:hypothetical protein
MNPGFRTIFVEVFSVEPPRSNNDKQSIKRVPRQLINSWLMQFRPVRAHKNRKTSALIVGLR